MVAAELRTDPRQVITLPGDYDEVPKLKSTQDNLEYLESIGFGYLFDKSKLEC